MSIEDCKAIMEQMKEDRKTAELYLIKYTELKMKYEKAKAEALSEERKQKKGEGKNPTQRKAVDSVAYDEASVEYEWLKAAEITQRSLGERKNIFIQVRREAERSNKNCPGRHGWVLYVQRRYEQEIENRFLSASGWMSYATIRNWWKDMVDRAVEIHLRIKSQKN